TIHVQSEALEYLLACPGKNRSVQGELHEDGAALTVELDGQRVQAAVVTNGNFLTVFTNSTSHQILMHDPLAGPSEEAAAPGSLSAPMAGTVISVSVQAGDEVHRGQALIVLEAMKMEHTLNAAADGQVTQI